MHLQKQRRKHQLEQVGNEKPLSSQTPHGSALPAPSKRPGRPPTASSPPTSLALESPVKSSSPKGPKRHSRHSFGSNFPALGHSLIFLPDTSNGEWRASRALDLPFAMGCAARGCPLIAKATLGGAQGLLPGGEAERGYQ